MQSRTPNLRSPTRSLRLLTACSLVVFLVGCPQPKSDPVEENAARRPLAGVRLRLAVVDDPAMAAAIGQLRGEWEALTGADLQVESISEEGLAEADSLPADAVVCSPAQLGPLAERKLIAPVPKGLLENNADDWADVFELLRIRDAVWGTATLAIPFGSPVLTCYYRADLLEKLDRRPPRTWQEYQELAALLADRSSLGDAAPPEGVPWSGTVEPLGPGWAGLVLLARAAPYAKHPDNYSTLFSIRTMEPLVAGPPFVRALEELVAAAKLGSHDGLQCDPASARAAFWKGQCGMALSWPTRAGDGLPGGVAGGASSDLGAGDRANAIQVGLAELPGSRDVYNVGNQSWENRSEDDDPHVPLLGVAGRSGVVGSGSKHPGPAFQLLLWLSGKRFGQRVCAVSPATTLFRRSQAESPQAWVEPPIPAAVTGQYAATTQRTLMQQQWLSAPRIPGRAEYLRALDEAVGRAARGERSAAEALRDAATRWREITQRHGLQAQKNAYLRSLGLAD